MDPNDYFKLMSKPNKMLILSKAFIFIGGFLCFLALFIPPMACYILLGIGGTLVLVSLSYTITKKLQNRTKSVKVVKTKEKIYKVEKIKEDPTKVISICPGCNKKIRLPNSKGKHFVTCPVCKKNYQIKI